MALKNVQLPEYCLVLKIWLKYVKWACYPCKSMCLLYEHIQIKIFSTLHILGNYDHELRMNRIKHINYADFKIASNYVLWLIMREEVE